MFITIWSGGMPFNGETLANGKSLGGSESAAYYLARELAAKGHRVTVYTHSREQGTWDGVTYRCAGQPSEAFPLGEDFHFYAEHTDMDALIVQRHPLAFAFPHNAKVALWWLHDLQRFSTRPLVMRQAAYIDRILAVSEWHKRQVMEVLGCPDEAVLPIANGVDHALYDGEVVTSKAVELRGKPGQVKLLYVSRPERGLENLVAEDGIMARLQQHSRFHLYVAGYDNTQPQLAAYYRGLWGQIDRLPNCTNLGPLGKQALADVQRSADLWIYPSTFEETSCISAMEAMAAGLPVLGCQVGALPETCAHAEAGVTLLPLRDGKVDIERFVAELLTESTANRTLQRKALREAARPFNWRRVAGMVEQEIERVLLEKTGDIPRMAKHFMHHSDVLPLSRYLTEQEAKGGLPDSAILNHVRADLAACYGFAREGRFAAHYRDYYAYERARGAEYGPENLDHNLRYRMVAARVAELPAGARVLDFGCAHGHYTVNLARRFPQLTFLGLDLEESNIATARKWAADAKLENVRFSQGETVEHVLEITDEPFDLVLAAEVLEHVADPRELADRLAALLKPGGLMVITVPAGPWEAQGYLEHHPWRAHLWHFERADLLEMFGGHPDYHIEVAQARPTAQNEMLANHLVTYRRPVAASGEIDFARKFARQAPRETVSLCMIVKDGERMLRQALDSIASVTDELIVGIDKTTTDRTEEVIAHFAEDRRDIPVTVFPIESPLEIGFAAARNLTLARATGDWIAWLDADEVVVGVENLGRYLRHNMFQAYILPQHHFSMFPAAVMAVNKPAKIFRNRRGVQFFGMVHEHPELAPNDGLGMVLEIGDVQIGHNGYVTEGVRRRRFERNHVLMLRDREQGPERVLGYYLWCRDLALLNRYDAENGNANAPVMLERAREGVKLWEKIIAKGPVTMAVDAIEFYSQHTQLLGMGFDFTVAMDAQKQFNGSSPDVRPVTAHFASMEHVKLLMGRLAEQKAAHLESRYW